MMNTDRNEIGMLIDQHGVAPFVDEVVSILDEKGKFTHDPELRDQCRKIVNALRHSPQLSDMMRICQSIADGDLGRLLNTKRFNDVLERIEADAKTQG